MEWIDELFIVVHVEAHANVAFVSFWMANKICFFFFISKAKRIKHTMRSSMCGSATKRSRCVEREQKKRETRINPV